PLKLSLHSYWRPSLPWGNFRAYSGAAPLKLPRVSAGPEGSEAGFPRLLRRGPIEAGCARSACELGAVFPRLLRRGPIEATFRLLMNHINQNISAPTQAR